MARLNYIPLRQLVEKIAAVSPYKSPHRPDVADLRRTTMLNLMLVSTACKEAVLEKFAQMTEVHFCNDGEEAHFYQHTEQQIADHITFGGPFIVTKWFAAYLSLHNCLHIQTLHFDATTTDSIRRRREGVAIMGDVRTVPTTSILSQLLEIDLETTGMHEHQPADLILDCVSVATHSDNLSDLDQFLALRPQEFHLEVLQGACPKNVLAGRSRISTPEPTVIRIDALYPTFPDLSLARDWTPLLAYLIDACPNLCSLALNFQVGKTSPFSALRPFPNEVFPHLHQYTGSLVVTFELGLFHREIVDLQRKGDRRMEEIQQTFEEETPPLEGEAVHRSMRWKRGRDSEPWRITLLVLNKGEMFPLIISYSCPARSHRHDDDEEEDDEGWVEKEEWDNDEDVFCDQ